MLNMAHVLEHGEYQIERYRVKLTQLDTDGWSSDSPWLRAVITNRRLLFVPEEDQNDCSPVVIPLAEIQKVWNIGLGRKDGLMLYLKTGQRVHMFVDWNQGRKLMRDTQEMMSVTPGATPNYLL